MRTLVENAFVIYVYLCHFASFRLSSAGVFKKYLIQSTAYGSFIHHQFSLVFLLCLPGRSAWKMHALRVSDTVCLHFKRHTRLARTRSVFRLFFAKIKYVHTKSMYVSTCNPIMRCGLILTFLSIPFLYFKIVIVQREADDETNTNERTKKIGVSSWFDQCCYSYKRRWTFIRDLSHKFHFHSQYSRCWQRATVLFSSPLSLFHPCLVFTRVVCIFFPTEHCT